MTRRTGSEIAEFLPPTEWFDRWWKPAEFAASVDAHKQTVPVVEFMCRTELKPLREAWAAARYATILSQDRPVSINLERDRFPDFNLRVRHELQWFELVEADREGRRRGEEYHRAAASEAAGQSLELVHFDPAEEEQAAIAAIIRAIEAKAGKHYKPKPHFLVYVNLWLDGDPPSAILQAVQSTERWRDAFTSFWLLWGGFIVRLWPRPAKIRDQSRWGR